MSFKLEVQADSSGDWTSNALRFATKDEAEAYGADLFARWMAVRVMRVIESEEPVNERFINGRSEAAKGD